MAEQRHQGRIELGGGEPESMLTHGKVRDLLSALHGCDGALVIGPGCRPCHALDAHGEVMRDLRWAACSLEQGPPTRRRIERGA
jgi:hypothetical protein